LPAPSQVRAGE
jgi:hypothetical protein